MGRICYGHERVNTNQFELFGINHRFNQISQRESKEKKREREERRGERESAVIFYLTFNRSEKKEDSPLILEKILFPAHLESHF